MEVPKNGICLMENPVEMDDLGDIWGYLQLHRPCQVTPQPSMLSHPAR